jgi:Resolvase, N terminal domain
VLTATADPAERVTTAHRAKLAYIYVRQSTAGQVRQHQESTELQYRLADRAAGLGWPRERIAVIDDDLGKSGASAAERRGFQRLIAEIGLGKAGLVLSSTPRGWPATTATGTSCWSCARSSAWSSATASGCMTPALTTTACCWACPAS